MNRHTIALVALIVATLAVGRARATGDAVQCADGTESKSCTTDQKSMQGCCSGHGGVKQGGCGGEDPPE